MLLSAALAVVLTVGLMPLPAFAETASGQQQGTPLVAAGSDALKAEPEMTAQWQYGDEKEITGLGTGDIANPQFANGGWNKVYFGSNEDSGEAPMLFNVLNTHETNFGGQTMFLDCSTIIENRAIGGARNNYFDSGTDYYLNNQFFETRFTTQEQNAIAQSVKLSQAPGDGMGWVDNQGGWPIAFLPYKRERARADLHPRRPRGDERILWLHRSRKNHQVLHAELHTEKARDH